MIEYRKIQPDDPGPRAAAQTLPPLDNATADAPRDPADGPLINQFGFPVRDPFVRPPALLHEAYDQGWRTGYRSGLFAAITVASVIMMGLILLLVL